MKLLFKQKLFSWFDSYDVYDADGNTVFTVKGELAWGHLFRIYDATGKELGYLKQRPFRLFGTFDMYSGVTHVGSIRERFSFFGHNFEIDLNGWSVEGNFIACDYVIIAPGGELIAEITRRIWEWTDTFEIDVKKTNDALYVLMVVIAIDADIESRNNH